MSRLCALVLLDHALLCRHHVWSRWIIYRGNYGYPAKSQRTWEPSFCSFFASSVSRCKWWVISQSCYREQLALHCEQLGSVLFSSVSRCEECGRFFLVSVVSFVLFFLSPFPLFSFKTLICFYLLPSRSELRCMARLWTLRLRCVKVRWHPYALKSVL